jgi:hypothetical protein
MLSTLKKIENVDRRVIFLLVLIMVIIPLLRPMGMDVQVTPPAQSIYDFVEKLPPGSVIWMGFDYYNTTRTECDAHATAFLRHAFRKDCKVFITCTIPDGNNISQIIAGKVAKEYGKSYGDDYCILGYKPGALILIKQVCDNIRNIYNTDIFGRSINDIPMMARVKNNKDIKMIFTSTDNSSFDEYVKVASTQYGIPMAGGSTAVSVPLLYIYINSGQAMGLLGGLKGAAEYEKLIGKKDTATSGMDAQSFVHLLIVLMLIFSNAVYFAKRRLEKEEST